MDSYENPLTSMNDKLAETRSSSDFTLREEIEQVLGGTLEGAYELRGGLGLLVTIKKDNKPYALVVQRPAEVHNPSTDTHIYITEGIGK